MNDKKKSGIFSSGSLGFTVGTQRLMTDQKNTYNTALASTADAIKGDVT